jgi:hypothetical protein
MNASGWAVGLSSPVVTGRGGEAIAVQHFRLQEWVDSVAGPVGRFNNKH